MVIHSHRQMIIYKHIHEHTHMNTQMRTFTPKYTQITFIHKHSQTYKYTFMQIHTLPQTH